MSAAVLLLLLTATGGGDGAGADLPASTVRAMAKRMLDTEPYLGSAEDKETRGQTGRYFTAMELQLLRGNPLLGYWHLGGFSWSGGGRVSWAGIATAHRSCRAIRPGAWAAAFEHVARRNQLVVGPGAKVQIEGGCVGAVVNPTAREPVPGVLLELRVKSPSGTLLYRVGMGKATVEDSIGAALDLVVQFTRSLPGEAERASSR